MITAILHFILGALVGVQLSYDGVNTIIGPKIKDQPAVRLQDSALNDNCSTKAVGDSRNNAILSALLSCTDSKKFEITNYDGVLGLQIKGKGRVEVIDETLNVYLKNVIFRGKPGFKHNPRLKWFKVELDKATPNGWDTPRKSNALEINQEFESDEKGFVLRDERLPIDIRGFDVSGCRLVLTGIDPTGGMWPTHSRQASY